MGFDFMRAQPARQPKAVATGFVGDGNPLDGAPVSQSFVTPAVAVAIAGPVRATSVAVVQVLPRYWRPANLTGPSRSEQRCVSFESDSGFAQIVRFRRTGVHRLSAVCSDDGAILRRAPDRNLNRSMASRPSPVLGLTPASARSPNHVSGCVSRHRAFATRSGSTPTFPHHAASSPHRCSSR